MKKLRTLQIGILILFIGIVFSSCSKTTKSTLTINFADASDYMIYVYQNKSVPTSWSSCPNRKTEPIAVGHINYVMSDKNSGVIPKVELNWPEGVLSGDFLVELSAFLASGYVITSFKKGNAEISFYELTVLNAPSLW